MGKKKKSVAPHLMNPAPMVNSGPTDNRRKPKFEKFTLQAFLRMQEEKEKLAQLNRESAPEVALLTGENQVPRRDQTAGTSEPVNGNSSLSEDIVQFVDYYLALHPDRTIESETLAALDETLGTEQPAQDSFQHVSSAQQALAIEQSTSVKSTDTTDGFLEQVQLKDIQTREQFIAAIQTFRVTVKDLEKLPATDAYLFLQGKLKECKEFFKSASIQDLTKWVTNGNISLDKLFTDKNNYPTSNVEKEAVLLGLFEIYCKLRSEGPNIKTYTGIFCNLFLPFFVTVFTGPQKIAAATEMQMSLLVFNCLENLNKELNNPLSHLGAHKNALTEKNSDLLKFTEQVLQFASPVQVNQETINLQVEQARPYQMAFN